ncbi:GNAT family N-acetyltransferase [Cohnella thailandensis]|uniref:GNAT family N-acetyltransferase n=1 Tax=Cohnella thailandensis TaxID=557557 RepID=A0A841T1D2_9BACL|nr:GNAT family N-acetyltransferase [Cohnella thailandensis]MBB6637984.1 GNAT family N-acetyltransferase [Cohnella thailandensis]MBP1976877.1 GNAT superfamily N-acetyltransferase [Cohnella thailandensis]
MKTIPSSFELIEPLTLNAWPALRQFVRDGWLLRLADGYTKRANSVQPLWPFDGETDMAGKIAWCEQVYNDAGLPAIFKLSPFSEPRNLDYLLEEASYRVVEPSCVKVRDLANLPIPSGRFRVLVEPRINEAWLSSFSVWQSLHADRLKTARLILEAPYPPKGFFTLSDDGIPVALGIGAIERGYAGLYDIVTDPFRRNEGIGEQLLLHILGWAKERGAHSSYLQVVRANAAANRLYDKLGYEDLYPYWYRVQTLNNGN